MFENVEVLMKAVEQNGMIEKLESGLLLFKPEIPEIIVSEQNVLKGGELLDFLFPSKD